MQLFAWRAGRDVSGVRTMGATPLYTLRGDDRNGQILHLDKVGTIKKGNYADIIAIPVILCRTFRKYTESNL